MENGIDGGRPVRKVMNAFILNDHNRIIELKRDMEGVGVNEKAEDAQHKRLEDPLMAHGNSHGKKMLLDFFISKTVDAMIVDHAGRLHVGVDHGRSQKFESSFF